MPFVALAVVVLILKVIVAYFWWIVGVISVIVLPFVVSATVTAYKSMPVSETRRFRRARRVVNQTSRKLIHDLKNLVRR
jgi:hypothetical protein